MPLVTAADGARIYFERLGPSPSSQANGRLPLLLLAPLGLNGRLWQAAAHLAAEDGYEVITIDNRGSGRSDSPRRPWTMGTMAHDVVCVLDEIGAPRAHVCGPSLGGLVAQELAILYPERVATLVLAATTPGLPRVDLLPWRSVARGVSVAFRRLVAPTGAKDASTKVFLKVFVSERFAEQESNDGSVWRAVEAMREDPAPARGTVGQLVAAATHWGATSRLRRIQAPTQIHHGTADSVVPARAGRALMKRIPHAELKLHVGAGHALIIERPTEAVTAAMHFVATYESRRRHTHRRVDASDADGLSGRIPSARTAWNHHGEQQQDA